MSNLWAIAMSNPDSEPDIDVCTLCLKEKPIIQTYKLPNLTYWVHHEFKKWIRKNLTMNAYSDVRTCSDCFKAWEYEDTSYLNAYVLKQKLLR